jgi:putative salt-induced outer membrane protein YdiY
MHARPLIVFSFVAIIFSGNAFAIVNIESARIQKKEDGFSGQLEVDASVQSGNTSNTRIGAGSRLQWIRGKVTDFIVLNYDYGESSSTRDINKAFLHGRHIVQRNEHWAWEAFGQLEQNEFTRLSFRALGGGGLRRTIREDADKGAMYVGVGGFYSTERLDDDSVSNLVRVNTYLVFKHVFNPTTHFVSTTYYQPATTDFDDYRALEQAALTVAINKSLNLKLSVDIAHDSQPPAGVKSTDTTFRTGIEYRF